MERGFVFSLSIIAIASVLVAFALFYFNSNESQKNSNLDFQELRKARYTLENFSSNFNEFFELNPSFKTNKMYFYTNLNNSKNFANFSLVQSFYEEVLSEFLVSDFDLNSQNLIDGNAELYFNNNTFIFDYLKPRIKVIPVSDINYTVTINASSGRISKTNWTYSSSGVYVTLNYTDLNGTESSSGYIDGSQACTSNYFSVDYNVSNLKINICKDNLVDNVLLIEESIKGTFVIDTNVVVLTNVNIENAYYNADINFVLNNTKYSGKIPVN
ncbi:MAG: hypothetical protein COT55_02200 [Candidatus Diapherotrites archaeon CG09_land_8_20_14_0_10_32_12]|nr:MAG: hypothetical protein COT55_02200 [Candidatus Diapherotrites archaeon CG09_land_8_20_14_0_10_32_12]